jgi:hypothetical protein
MTSIAAPTEQRMHELSRVSNELDVARILQPDDTTCGPTCLLKVFGFYGYQTTLLDLIAALERNEDGGTLAVFLGILALEKGYKARIYSYDLRIFDPTWYELSSAQLKAKILARYPHLTDEKRKRAALAYIRFLDLGGELAFDELRPPLLKEIIDRGHPVLAGLSATYLYRFARERYDDACSGHIDDDIAGEATGHFVVINGYDHWGRRVILVDPSEHVPAGDNGRVIVDSDRLINSILLGDATHDAVLLEIWP